MNLSLVSPSGYAKHETGGEHAIKHMYDPDVFVQIRREEFGDRVQERNPSEIFSTMSDEQDGGLLNVLKVGYGGKVSMVGGALYRNELRPGQRIITVDASDIVVGPQHRNQGVGSWLLARLMLSGAYFNARANSQMFATDLSITDESDIMHDWHRSKADELGMTATDAGFHYYLPGLYAHVTHSIDELPEAREHTAKHRYTGSILFEVDRAKSRRYVFRQGHLLGWIEAVEVEPEEQYDHKLPLFSIMNIVDNSVRTEALYDEMFAITSLLNTDSVRAQIQANEAL